MQWKGVCFSTKSTPKTRKLEPAILCIHRLMTMFELEFACLVLLLLLAAPCSSQRSTSWILPGSSLFPTKAPSSWASRNGLFHFGFYPQGRRYAVGIWLSGLPGDSDTITWTANRDGPLVSPNSSIYFSKEGKLMLQTESGQAPLITEDTSDGEPVPAVSASMLDKGNFVLYGYASRIVWQSFDFPTDTILEGQNLSSGKSLFSSKSLSDCSTGRASLVMQDDGNLVMYPVNSTNAPDDSYWSTATLNGRNVLLLDSSGTLSLKGEGSGITIQNITNGNRMYKPDENDSVIYRATLDIDGNFRLYMHRFIRGNFSNAKMSLVWSALESECDIKGLCGVNSYCKSSNGTEKSKGQCYCFPGFDFIDPGNKFYPGCYRKVNWKERCQGKNPSTSLSINHVNNATFHGHPYSVLSNSIKRCEESCLNDCHCEVALHSNGTCSKFKLPTLYGVMNASDAAVVLLKQANLTNAHHLQPTVQLFPSSIEHKTTILIILAASLGTVAVLCFLAAVLVFGIYQTRLYSYRKLNTDSNLVQMKEFTLQSFSYDELSEATGEFSEELGRDCFGAVYYRGFMNISGATKVVSIKKLERLAEQGEHEFRAEMNMTGHTHHRNLVRLLGFCMEGSKKLLVYEHTSNGSLADLLFNPETRPSWKDRLRIALQIARGILYLHQECELQIVHCNIKAQTILMDESWMAKISDFSLATLLMPNQTNRARRVTGARGYEAPELLRNGLLTTKTDIYSFGILMLEIICCTGANVPQSERFLSTWVTNCYVAGELQKLISFESVDMTSLKRMITISLLCIQDDPNHRPSIKDVILMLEGIMDVPEPPLTMQPSDVPETHDMFN